MHVCHVTIRKVGVQSDTHTHTHTLTVLSTVVGTGVHGDTLIHISVSTAVHIHKNEPNNVDPAKCRSQLKKCKYFARCESFCLLCLKHTEGNFFQVEKKIFLRGKEIVAFNGGNNHVVQFGRGKGA